MDDSEDDLYSEEDSDEDHLEQDGDEGDAGTGDKRPRAAADAVGDRKRIERDCGVAEKRGSGATRSATRRAKSR